MSKKILILSEYSMGRYIEGTNKVILELSKALQKNNYEVTILTPKWPQDEGLETDYNMDGVKIHRFYFPFIGNPAFRSLGYFLNGLTFCLKNKYAIIYGLYTAAPIIAAGFLGRLFSKKTVASIWEPPTVNVLKKIRFPIMNCIDRILTLSDYMTLMTERELKIKNSRVKTIYGQYDGNMFYPYKKDDNLLKKYNPSNKFLILSVGRVSRLKGVPDLLAATKDLDAVVLFVGREVEPDKIQKNKNSVFAGFVETKELPKYYNTCDLFILPSHNEGFGLVVAEAMACGAPIIVSDTPPLPEVAGNGGLVFPVGDAKKLREFIEYLMNNSDKLKDLKKNALERAKEFEKERIMKQYLTFFKSL